MWQIFIFLSLLITTHHVYSQNIPNDENQYIVTFKDTLNGIPYNQYYCKDSLKPGVKIEDILINRYVFNDLVTYIKYRNGVRFAKSEFNNGVKTYEKGFCDMWKKDWYEEGILPEPRQKPEILMDAREKHALDKFKIKLQEEGKLAKSKYHKGIYPVLVYRDYLTSEMEVFYLSRYHDGDTVRVDYRCQKIIL